MPDSPSTRIQRVAEADFPTEYGHFRIYGFEWQGDEKTEELVAITMGDLGSAEPLLVRVHSQCLTGDVFHSLRCDCRAQLELAMSSVAEEGRGMVIYEKKEGRGIGLLNKLRAYELQDKGADTVEANEQLGFEADLRGYEAPANILHHFGISRVRLMTNNPDKVSALENYGVTVVESVPCQAQRSHHSDRYLRTKKERMGHLLEF